MDIKQILNLLSNSNINKSSVESLIKEASSLDLSDEKNIRYLIRKSSDVTNKTISTEMEDKIVKILQEKGISRELLNSVGACKNL